MIIRYSTICGNCGYRSGRHNAMTEQCPKGPSDTGYFRKTKFKWKKSARRSDTDQQGDSK